MKKNQLLLLEDVDGLGRSGDVVTAKAGYVRNFLLPQKKALVANKQTLKIRVKLQEERERKASSDRKEAEELSTRLEGFVLSREVKVDPEGHMYGSVTALDLARMMQEKGYPIEKRNIALIQPIKTVGKHNIPLKLKENVLSQFQLEILPEGGFPEQASA
jgi:large subunit ribosomal protein L9